MAKLSTGIDQELKEARSPGVCVCVCVIFGCYLPTPPSRLTYHIQPTSKSPLYEIHSTSRELSGLSLQLQKRQPAPKD